MRPLRREAIVERENRPAFAREVTREGAVVSRRAVLPRSAMNVHEHRSHGRAWVLRGAVQMNIERQHFGRKPRPCVATECVEENLAYAWSAQWSSRKSLLRPLPLYVLDSARSLRQRPERYDEPCNEDENQRTPCIARERDADGVGHDEPRPELACDHRGGPQRLGRQRVELHDSNEYAKEGKQPESDLHGWLGFIDPFRRAGISSSCFD